MPLIIHTVSDALLETMPDVDQPLFQFIDLMNFRLADRPGFVEDMTKTFFCVFLFTVYMSELSSSSSLHCLLTRQ